MRPSAFGLPSDFSHLPNENNNIQCPLPEGFDFVTQRDLKMFGFIICIKKKWLKPGVVTGTCKLSTQEAEYSVLSRMADDSRQPDLKDKSRWSKDLKEWE